MLQEINKEYIDRDINEINKLQNILLEPREMKLKILQIETDERMKIDTTVNETKENSLLIINNHKLEISNANEKLKSVKIEDEE
jgi:hypothetical protein